jgi:hypothetical protein
MTDFGEAKAFADTAFSPKQEKLLRRQQTDFTLLTGMMNAKGDLSSSAMAKRAAELYAKTTYDTLHARADALLEGVELYDVPLDEVRHLILTELEQMKAELVRTFSIRLESLPYLRSLGMGAYIVSELDRAGNQALNEIRTTIERKRLRKQQPAQERQNVTNVYHVYGHNPRWNTNSTDNSLNVVTTSNDQIFANLRQEIVDNTQDGEEQRDILQRLDCLEQA